MQIPQLQEFTAPEMLAVFDQLKTENPGKILPHDWIDPTMPNRREFLSRCLSTPTSVLLAAGESPDVNLAFHLKTEKHTQTLRSSHPASRLYNLKGVETVAEFKQILSELGIAEFIPVDDQVKPASEGSYLGRTVKFGRRESQNGCLIQPMENVSCNTDGSPRFASLCRYVDFGCSGAGIIWSEAGSIRPDGRANPYQLQMTQENLDGVRHLFNGAYDAHEEIYGKESRDKLIVGAQLTYSGRNNFEKRKAMFRHPVYEDGANPHATEKQVDIFSDQELDELIKSYVDAAKVAAKAGAKFVDVKACHGYLLHESLAAFTREGKYGGTSLEERANLLLSIIKAIKAEPECQDLEICVRLSIFDSVPLRYVDPESGELKDSFKEKFLPYNYAFGVNPEDPLQIDLTETVQLISMLKDAGVSIVNCSAGNPYETFNSERPANKDWLGIKMPYDGLVGVATLIEATRRLQITTDIPLVSSGTSALRQFLPNVMEAALRQGHFHFFGAGKSSIIDLFWPQRYLVHGDAMQSQAMAEKAQCIDALGCVGFMRMTAAEYMSIPEETRDRKDDISSFCVIDNRWKIWGKEFLQRYAAYRKGELNKK